jgi:membrane-associated protease RseP (regulator of RpoE activity)
MAEPSWPSAGPDHATEGPGHATEGPGQATEAAANGAHEDGRNHARSASSEEPAPPGRVKSGQGVRPGRAGRSGPESMDEREQWGALLRLVLVVVAGLVVAEYLGALATVLVVLALIVMIVLHEFGHFVTAKLAGMKVSEFFVGFGPRLWSVTKGETTYGIKALPLGGYCRIIGMTNVEEVDPADEPRAYRNQPTWRRLTVAFAGSFVHFVLAFVMLVVLFLGPGDIGNFVTNPPASNPIGMVDSFTTGKSPAQLAGLKAGDQILAVNGRHFATWDQLTEYLRARAGQKITLTVRGQGHTFTTSTVLANGAKVTVTGMSAPIDTKKTGLLGVEQGPARFGFLGSIEHAGTAFGATAVNSVKGLGTVIGNVGGYVKMLGSQQVADSPTAKRFVSPVGVVRLAHEATEIGWSEVLYLLIIINLFVGIFNLVPLLPLDGGHVAIALYEKVRSLRSKRPYHADVNKLAPVLYAVLAILAFYALSSLFLDLRDLLS